MGNERLEAMRAKLDEFARLLALEAKEQELAKLEARMSDGDFWNDQALARTVMTQTKSLKSVLEPFRKLERAVKDGIELHELASDEKDAGALAEVDAECARLEADYSALELKLALTGRYDASDVFMTIHPGAGGTESQDWAEMLFRMYKLYFARIGWDFAVMEMLPGEGTGIKSCTISVKGDNVYGFLKSEMGTHRLVRISPFDANARRQTSFAAVEVTPELDEVEDFVIDEKDLRIDTFRSSGAGGQHVNKTDSAVRITHIPTNLVTSCQTERSQLQNKGRAMKMLGAKLQQLRETERLEELSDLKGDRGTIGWGHQIRSYVLMPYQMVKDLRTGQQTSQVQAVLDGDLQQFVDSYLRWRLGGSKDRRAELKDLD